MSSPLAILKAFLLLAALVLLPLGVFGLCCLRTWHYDRFSIGSIVPEIDQIRAGYAVAQALDPFFD